MLIICFRCGSEKEDPFQVCTKCKSQPQTEEEMVLSALLSEYLLDHKTLIKAAESDSHRDPKKISKAAYDLIAGFLREDGFLPTKPQLRLVSSRPKTEAQ